ncbi:MAG: helix-turn-helix domain-containing protein [Candidatus Shapirobacteria bacterium]|nr:helix-turn-helix domain-containing protein [Candidatus Shapirobacteria bacterium]
MIKINKKGCTWIPNYWIVGDDISDAAFRTLSIIRSYNFDQIYPSVKRIAERRGKSRSTIFLHLKELKEKKYITTKRSGYSTSNIYKFSSPENWTNESNPTSNNDTSIVQETGLQSSNNPDPNNSLNKELKNSQNPLRGEELEKAKENLFNKLPWVNKNKNHLKK